MQTPKARTNSTGAPQRTSPKSISSEASQKNSPQAAVSEVSQKDCPKVVRQLKTSTRYLEPTASSSNLATRSPKERSPKVADRKSPRSPLPEKKQPGRVAELESQISQLENDLQNVKDRLCSSETSKKQAHKDAEESKEQLIALTTKLEESQKQISEQSSSQDSAALASAQDEIEKLKSQLEMVAESEATRIKNSESAQIELQKLRENLAETLSVLEEMKKQLSDCKKSESEAQEIVSETLLQLETAKKMVENLRWDGCKATEAYDTVSAELDQSRARVEFLEELVSKLKADMENRNSKYQILEEKDGLEIKQLRKALEAAEIRNNEEISRSAEELRKVHAIVDQIKSDSGMREAELEAELRKSKYEIEELRGSLMDKETELQGICEENEDLTMQLENSLSGQKEQELVAQLENLKVRLEDKEAENETLKLDIKETRKAKTSDEVLCDLEAARIGEREALMKVGYMTEEADKSKRKAARVAEQLEAAQKGNAEMESELRRLKVQSDQWRKAAEAAAAMLSSGNNNGQFVERTGSMDCNFGPRMGRIGLPYGDEGDEDLLKKKNANMLRRLWKKGQK